MATAALFAMTSFYVLVLFFLTSVALIYLSPKRWHGLLVVFLGLLTGFIDVQSSEVSFTILLLISFGFFLGFTKPATPLRTGFLFGLWLPLVTIVHHAVLGNESTFLSNSIAALFAFIPAIAGSYLGVFIREHGGVVTEAQDPAI